MIDEGRIAEARAELAALDERHRVVVDALNQAIATASNDVERARLKKLRGRITNRDGLPSRSRDLREIIAICEELNAEELGADAE